MVKRFIQKVFACGIVMLTAAGCTNQQAYSAGQEWQRNQCNQMNNNVERARCLEQTNTPYQDYRRQTEELKKQ